MRLGYHLNADVQERTYLLQISGEYKSSQQEEYRESNKLQTDQFCSYSRFLPTPTGRQSGNGEKGGDGEGEQIGRFLCKLTSQV